MIGGKNIPTDKKCMSLSNKSLKKFQKTSRYPPLTVPVFSCEYAFKQKYPTKNPYKIENLLRNQIRNQRIK